MFQIGVRKITSTVIFLDAQNCILEALGKQMSVYSSKSL